MSIRTIAVYNGSTVHTRVLDVKSVNKALQTSLKKDLVWDAANRWTLDVTDAPKEVLEYLKSDEGFKLEHRDVDGEADAMDTPEVAQPVISQTTRK